MKGLKIIPLFLVLIILSYVGMLFVEANREDVIITFFELQTPPMALGFVVLTSALIGMLFAGILCLLELVVLYLQNKNLKRKLEALGEKTTSTFGEVVTGEPLTSTKSKTKKDEKTASSASTQKAPKLSASSDLSLPSGFEETSKDEDSKKKSQKTTQVKSKAISSEKHPENA